MTLERLTQLIQAYGGDPRRWPPAERAAAEALLHRSPEARYRLTDARALDELLDTVVIAPAGGELRKRIYAHALPSPAVPSEEAHFWPFQSWWPQVAATAAAIVLGLFVGARVLPPPIDRAEIEASEVVFGTGGIDGWDR
jgi:hypothetical protein